MRDIYCTLKETTCAVSTWGGAPCSRMTKAGGEGGGVLLLLMRRASHNQTGGRGGGERCVGRRDWCGFWWNERKRCGGISSHGSSLEEQEDASVRMFHPPTVSLMMHLSFCTVPLLFSLSLLLLLSSTSVRRLDRSLDSVGESISISLHCYLRAAETKAMAFSVSDDYQSTRLNQITRKKDKEGFPEWMQNNTNITFLNC